MPGSGQLRTSMRSQNGIEVRIRALHCCFVSSFYFCTKDDWMTLRFWLAVLAVSCVLVPNAVVAQSDGVKPAEAELGRGTQLGRGTPAPVGKDSVFGYTDFSKQAGIEQKFLAVPSAKLAGEELKTLTAE